LLREERPRNDICKKGGKNLPGGLYNPDQLTPNEVLDYWTQINNMLHELAHVFGAGIGEYYNLSNIQDKTGAEPLLNINILDQNDPFWSDKPDFMTDPLLKNPAQSNIAGQSDNRENLLNFVEYSELTAAIINNNYRNGTPTVDLSQINIRVVSEDGSPVESAEIKVWSVIGSFPYPAQLMVDDFSNTDGKLSFAWGGMSNPHNSNDFLRLIKVYKEGYTAPAKYVSIFDADIAKLVDGINFLDITIQLSEIGTSDKTLPASWIGGVSISSDKNVVAVSRPHIGNEIASYAGFSAGSLTAYVPMLFKNAFSAGSYDSALYIQNVDASIPSNITIEYYDSLGNLTCTVPDTIEPLASKGYWLPGLSAVCLPDGWVGGAIVTSDANIVANGRPHINGEVMTYDGFSSGSLTSYLPMLFKNAFTGGSYDSAFYVQNVGGSQATITMQYYDNTGALTCTNSDTVAPFASKGYWLPSLSADCLPDGWAGGVLVTSDQMIVSVGRPHIGSQVTIYNGFSAGAESAYVPMLFKNAYSGGSYDSAFYVQNVDASTVANLTIKYYELDGTLTCTVFDTVAELASKGYWLPSLPADCLPDGWVGGVVVTSDVDIVAIGRPHIGAQVTTYNGFTSGSSNSYLPMLFKDAFSGGSYDSAFYIQNTEATAAKVITKFYDSTGALTCTRNDTLPAFSTLSLWLPSLTCAS
jgi:hypothetical protein